MVGHLSRGEQREMQNILLPEGRRNKVEEGMKVRHKEGICFKPT